jgi:hypothetical protein
VEEQLREGVAARLAVPGRDGDDGVRAKGVHHRRDRLEGNGR